MSHRRRDNITEELVKHKAKIVSYSYSSKLELKWGDIKLYVEPTINIYPNTYEINDNYEINDFRSIRLGLPSFFNDDININLSMLLLQ